MDNKLVVNGLKFSYKDRNIFNDLSFTLKENSINCFIGPNSCGKTTLIRLLSGFLKNNRSIYYNNMELNKKNINRIFSNIGVVFYQNKYNFLFENVIDELRFSLENLNYSSEKITKTINYYLDLFDEKKIIEKKIFDLDEFEKVKLLVIISLLHEPKFVLYDSLFDSLLKNEKQFIFNILKNLNVTVLFTTNNIINCVFSDNILLYDGTKIAFEGSLDDVLSHDNEIVKNGIDIPFMMDLCLKLKFYNLLNNLVLEPESLVDVLWN